MNALQRIKEIEMCCVCSNGCNSCSSYKFLLKAFNVMREIAIEEELWNLVDVEFEERMLK